VLFPRREFMRNDGQRGWEGLYRAALLEEDGAKLLARCDEAEAAIKERLRQVMAEAGDSTAERQQLSSALRNIALLRTEPRE